MEKLRPARSKLPSGSERRSSGDRFASKERASSRGNRPVQKQKKLGSDSSSCSSGSTGEDPLTFELGWRSSKQAGGAPMKKLLAEEMWRETELRRRSPSVIAKLMGLDGMPPQQPMTHKQQKGIPENRHQRTRSVENEHRSGVGYDNHRSFRKNSREQQDFKDVFEVLESSKVETCSYSSRAAANSKLSDAELAFVRQKFMDAKRLSTDEKLQDSKEFHDALEVLDSNKDLLLKFLQQPDSLFTKHLHDLHTGPQFHCGRVASMKSSEASKYDKIDLGWTSARETPLRNYCKSPQRHRDSFSSYSDSRHATRYSLKSQNRSEAKHEIAVTPTRIVVLKPNLGTVLNPTKTISSPCSSQASMSVCRNRSEFPGIGHREVDTWGKKNFPDNEGQSRHKSRESREVAREITRQMRKNLSNSSVQFSTGFKGYAGDESSCSMSENESGNESEVISVASKQFSGIQNYSRRSSTCSTESSVSREAKKRLSERWKVTHKSQEMGVASRGSTLAEMLAIPDKEIQAAKLDTMKGEAGFRDRFSREDGPVGWGGPLGISSRDGWKDECISSLSRSRSLPASSSAFGSYKTSMCRETIRDDRYLIPTEAFKHKRNRSVEVDFDQREGGRRNYRSRSKRSYSSRSLSRESMDISPETPNTPDGVRTDPEENKQSQQNISVVESSSGFGIDASPASVKLVDVDVPISSEMRDAFPPELSARTSVEGESCSSHQDNLIAEEPSTRLSDEKSVPAEHSVPGLESLASLKEADQPSPVSVLEVPFIDDVSSSSDCFETLSADLQGLRMQLQLLKLESDSYAEGSMLISSDEDAGEGSSWFRHACREEESWESSYMVDMLTESGLNNADHDTFLATWHSPECPVSPVLFEELEKKYSDETPCPKSERKLLFDRINLGLLEMFQQFTDPHPWVRPMKITVRPKWINRTAVQDDLPKLLAGEENANEESLDKLLERDSLWLHFRDYTDIIGREIERSLLDELVAEVVVMKW